MFVPDCGLWPTWTCCPTPKRFRFPSVRVSFRIFHADDLDNPQAEEAREGVEPYQGVLDLLNAAALSFPDPQAGASKPAAAEDQAPKFADCFRGVSSSFDATATHPNPPPGAWNFYRLLASFLALGPAGLFSPYLHSRRPGALLISPPRYTVHRLILAVTSKVRSESDILRNLMAGLDRNMAVTEDNTIPFGGAAEKALYPGPLADWPDHAPYVWTGPTTIFTAAGQYYGAGDRYGFWLACALWGLLGFDPLSRGFGLVVYECVLDAIEFWVDGQRRQTYDMEGMLARLETAEITSENREILREWRAWLETWKGERCEAAVDDPPPASAWMSRPLLPFPRYQEHRNWHDDIFNRVFDAW